MKMQPPFIQREEVRDEGVWHYVENMTLEHCRLMYDTETAFCGRGAKQKAERALRILGERIRQQDAV